MTIDNILTTAVGLFISDKLRVDIVALLVLAALILTGLVTSEQAFAGFASPAVVTVWAVFIISGAMFYTGVADWLAAHMLEWGGQSLMSAFMNNVGAVAILMPAVISVSRRLKITPSKMLMPLAFAALLGGNLTLIGTPPNILATDILRTYDSVPSFTFLTSCPWGRWCSRPGCCT